MLVAKWYKFWLSLSDIKREYIVLYFNIVKITCVVPFFIICAYGFSRVTYIVLDNLSGLSAKHYEVHRVWNPEMKELSEIEFSEKTKDMLVFRLSNISEVSKLRQERLAAYHRNYSINQNKLPIITYHLILDDNLVFVLDTTLPKITWSRPYTIGGATISHNYVKIEYNLMHPIAIFFRIFVFAGVFASLVITILFAMIFTIDSYEWICKSYLNINNENINKRFRALREEVSS